MKKVIVVITARPSYTRIKEVLEILKNSKVVDMRIVTCASANSDKYGKVVNQIKKDGFKVYATLDTYIDENPDTSMTLTTAKGIEKLTEIFEKDRPDAVITIADRFETIATAITSSYMNIPLIHIQGRRKNR